MGDRPGSGSVKAGVVFGSGSAGAGVGLGAGWVGTGTGLGSGSIGAGIIDGAGIQLMIHKARTTNTVATGNSLLIKPPALNPVFFFQVISYQVS